MTALCPDHRREWEAWLDYRPVRGIRFVNNAAFDMTPAGVRQNRASTADDWAATIRSQHALITAACTSQCRQVIELSVARPRLLDLFCGAGGAAMGYHLAGFDVVGVDHHPQPRYPFRFHQADALQFLAAHGREFDAIHASPPCQAYSVAAQSRRNAGHTYPDLLAPTRAGLETAGKPWVIENVPGAPMRPDFRLCGCQFGLELRRERWFETSWHGYALRPPCHHPHPVVSVVGHGTPTWVRLQLGFNPTIADYRAAMGIDWMTRTELSQAIPPAYTEHIGRLLLSELEGAAA